MENSESDTAVMADNVTKDVIVSRLLELRSRGVAIVPKAGSLSCRGPGEALDSDTLDWIRGAKPVLLAVLQAEQHENDRIPRRRCYCCKGRRFWFSIHRHWVCAECHFPGSPELVQARHTVPVEDVVPEVDV